jgi:hypothetical protein
MDTPFRNDVDALEMRLSSLDEELSALRSRAREYEAVRERLAQVEREHEDLRREVDARKVKRAAPLLDNLRIASPCNESWENMIGDDRTRFCARCEKHVHNLSALTRDQAEAFLERVTESACVRMYQRTDGTVLTADCPVGMRKKRVKRLFLATVGTGLAAAAGAIAFWAFEERVVMGEMRDVAGGVGPMPTQVTDPPAPSFATPPERHELTGVIAPLDERPSPPPRKPAVPQKVR